jgi:hypothetical protein
MNLKLLHRKFDAVCKSIFNLEIVVLNKTPIQNDSINATNQKTTLANPIHLDEKNEDMFEIKT